MAVNKADDDSLKFKIEIYSIFSYFTFKKTDNRKLKLFTIIGLSTLLISCIFLTFPSNIS